MATTKATKGRRNGAPLVQTNPRSERTAQNERFVIDSPERAAAFTLIQALSGAKNSEAPVWPGPWPTLGHSGASDSEGYGNHFTFGATQANVDLALLAQLELDMELEFGGREPNGYHLIATPMYWKLRQRFVDEAMAGDPYAFAHAIWRAYSAGQLSPERLSLTEKPPAA